MHTRLTFEPRQVRSDRKPQPILGAQIDAEGEDFRNEFLALGPRAASAVRAFLKIVADDDLDLDLAWMEPRKPTIAAQVTASQARFIEQAIARSNLDVDQMDIVGTVHTISDFRPLDIEGDGRVWRISLGDAPPPNVRDLNVGDEVRATVSVSTEQRVGGEEVISYTLIEISRLGTPTTG
jgi:hypothetical protein